MPSRIRESKSPRKFSRLRFLTSRSCLPLECVETLVFRRQVNGVICNSTPWACTDFNHCLKHPGFLSGHPQELSSYALRRFRKPRGTRIWVTQGPVFSAAITWWTKSAYLGTTSRADPIKTIGLMNNKRGPRAPARPDAEDPGNGKLKTNPEPSAW